MLDYKIDGHEDNYIAYSLFEDWEDGEGTIEELFKNESKSVKTAAFHRYPAGTSDPEYVRALLKIGADPNYTDCDEYSLLENVMIVRNEETLLTLLAYSPEMRIRKYIYDGAIKEGGIWADVAKRCEIFDDEANL